MTSKVALVKVGKNVNASLKEAFKLIGGIADLNSAKSDVVIKLGVFNPIQGQHTTIDVTQAIIENFSKAPRILLAESDNSRGTATARLQIWQELFTKRVNPFNLSEDTITRNVVIADEEMALSHILFKPNVFVSTHALRKYEKGTILKNLIGLVPMKKKAQFHRKLVSVLLDLYEAIGGIDLALIDATYTFPGPSSSKGVRTNLIIVGRDAVAVEAVGARLVGLKLEKMPIIQEAISRGLGEGSLEQIEVIGNSLEQLSKEVRSILKRS
jgi:uncharacterized protein (DUF362 family)